ncbi:MAG: DNA-formamidopyrimidine glycosylase, partial [Actinobacteria bacterium]|nr:DNA-formamidopyrimidine glycosylase [Actinomycetota bacterium]
MMFELPEVETVRRELDRDLVGKKVKSVEASSMAVLKRYKNRKAFTGQLDDMKITGVGRRGLYLLIVLDG